MRCPSRLRSLSSVGSFVSFSQESNRSFRPLLLRPLTSFSLLSHTYSLSTDSVRCDTCKTFYHMKCLSPPLLAKPAKGYSWSCAPCSKKHEDSVGAYASGSGLSVNPLAPGTITEIDPEKEKERERLEEAERKKGSKPSLKPQAQPRPRNNPRRKGDREGITLGQYSRGLSLSYSGQC